jgi:hypothetical protein
MIPELTRLAESWQALPPQQYDAGGNYVPGTAEQRERSDAMEAVLDALIQLHGTVSAEAVEGLLQDFTPRVVAESILTAVRVLGEESVRARNRGLSSNGTENPHKSLVGLRVKLGPGWRCVDREEV